MTESAPPTRVDIRSLVAPATIAFAWWAGLVVSGFPVPGDERHFVASVLRQSMPVSTMVLAAVWHAALIALAGAARLPRKSAHISAAYPYVVAAAWGDPVAMTAAACIGLADLWMETDRPRGAKGWIAAGLAVSAFAFFAIPSAMAGSISAGLIGATAFVAVVSVFARRAPLFEIARAELRILGASALAGIAASAAARFSGGNPAFALAAMLVAWGVLHARDLQRRQASVRAFHAAMILTVLASVAALDFALAPMKILLPETPPDPAARVASRPAGERVVPPGFFNNDGDPGGWWIETGFFRAGAPSPQKAPGATRVVVQGSSTTACLHLDNIQDVWTSVLESSLNAASPARSVEVINAGIQGTTTLGMLLNLRAAIIPLHPDLIVLYASANDATYGHGPLTQRQMYDLSRAGAFERDASEDVRVFTAGGEAASARRMAVTQVLMRSTLYRLLASRVFAARGANSALASLVPAVPAVPLSDFQRNLDEFADECARAGIRLVMIGEGVRIDIDDYKTVMKDVARSRGVAYIDAQPILDGCGPPLDRLVFDTVHLTVEGGLCLGAGLARELDARGLVSEPAMGSVP